MNYSFNVGKPAQKSYRINLVFKIGTLLELQTSAACFCTIKSLKISFKTYGTNS